MGPRETKPIWTTSTFLVYTGGLTVLGGGIGALAYLSTQFPGHGQQTAWALVILVILYVIARALLRADRPMAAGIFAFASVIAWAVLVGEAFDWFGWTNGSFNNFRVWSWSRLVFEFLILLAAWDDRRRFRFPFIRLISAVVGFVFILDLLTKGHGNSAAVVALIVGLLYLLVGNVSDKPSAFWLHLVAGLLIGVPILYWCHTSDFDFAVVSFMSLVYVMWSYWTRRSSWAVYGTIGFFIATVHYLIGSPTALAEGAFGLGSGQLCNSSTGIAPTCTSYGPHITAWSFPLAFGLLGFWLVGLGMLGKRRHHKAVVVERTVVVETTEAPPAE